MAVMNMNGAKHTGYGKGMDGKGRKRTRMEVAMRVMAVSVVPIESEGGQWKEI